MNDRMVNNKKIEDDEEEEDNTDKRTDIFNESYHRRNCECQCVQMMVFHLFQCTIQQLSP